MAAPLKLIQISDPHLCADAGALLHGWHVERAWRRVADDAMARHPDADLWVLSGDLVDDESAAGYRRLNTQLAALPCPVLALAGNHDDPQAMRRHLTRAHVHAPVALEGWRLYALNSHLDGDDAGRVDERQIKQLRQFLAADSTPAVICIHHPPVATGCAWIDGIGLHGGDALCESIRDSTHVAAVLCGHAHQALATRIGRAACWVTPSTMRQFLPGAEHFALDTRAAPGYRVISLHDNGRASSRVERVAGPFR